MCCKYVGSTSTLDNVVTKLMDLLLLLQWFKGPMDRRGATAGVGSEGSSTASIHEGKWNNTLGTTP